MVRRDPNYLPQSLRISEKCMFSKTISVGSSAETIVIPLWFCLYMKSGITLYQNFLFHYLTTLFLSICDWNVIKAFPTKDLISVPFLKFSSRLSMLSTKPSIYFYNLAIFTLSTEIFNSWHFVSKAYISFIATTFYWWIASYFCIFQQTLTFLISQLNSLYAHSCITLWASIFSPWGNWNPVKRTVKSPAEIVLSSILIE